VTRSSVKTPPSASDPFVLLNFGPLEDCFFSFFFGSVSIIYMSGGGLAKNTFFKYFIVIVRTFIYIIYSGRGKFIPREKFMPRHFGH
jgi:hypothetical protein